MSIARSLDGVDSRWSAPAPKLCRSYLAVGMEVDVGRFVGLGEVRFLHGALTAILGRDHGRRPDWSLAPVSASPSGWAAVWWSPHDGLSLARSSHRVRIGKRPATLRFGTPIYLHAPPAYVPAAHTVRLSTRTPVCSSRHLFRSDPARSQTVWRTEPAASAMVSMLATLAEKLEVDAAPHVEILDESTRAESVKLGGKLGIRHGWAGETRLIVNAPARWLLDAAGRGLGIGHSTAFGLGAVEVRTWP